jgi:F0F1-type ATP synthase assembly protein I
MHSFFERVRPGTLDLTAAPSDQRRAQAASALDLVVRGVLLGAGIGAILAASGRDGMVVVVFAGILAIGAAIAELGA